MSTSITSLTDEQAIGAVRLFLDFSTPELWAGGRKPTPERVKQVSDAMVANAPGDIQQVVGALAQDGKTESTSAQAEAARLILHRLSQTAEFQPAVNQAVETARQAHKFIDPVTGAFILTFLLATTRIEPGPNGRKISFGGGMPDILRELPAVIKALPEGVWSALRGTPK